MGEPKILILDEPTVGLDPNQTKEVRDLIKRLGKEHTIIFSSHILSEVNAVCDRVLISNDGKIKAQDTAENLETNTDEIVINLQVEGSKDTVISILNKIDGVTSVDNVQPVEDEENTYSYRVYINDDKVRKTIVSKLTSADCSILEINTIKKSLEEVFMDLTSK